VTDDPRAVVGQFKAPPLLDSGSDADAHRAPDAKVTLIRGGVLRLGSYVATLGLSVLSTALLTRHLGVSKFGDYTTVTSIVAVIAVVTDSGMSNIGTREYATLNGEARRRLLADLLGLRIALSVLGIGLVVALAVALGFGHAFEVGAIAASLATVALVFQHTLTIPLTVDLRFGWLSSLEFLRQTVTVAGVVLLVVLHAGVFPLLTTTLIANALLIFPTAALVRGRISLRPSFRLGRWRDLMGATVAFSLAAAVGIIYVYTAQILTHVVAGSYQSGLFSISFRVFIVVAAVPGLLVGGALPVLSRAAQDDRDRLGYILQRMFEATLVGGVGLAVTMSAGAGFIVEVIDTRAPGATSVLEIQSFALIASFTTAVWGFGLLSLRRHRGLLVANAAAFVVSLAATLILAADDGARGAAIATICGETALAVGSVIALVTSNPEYRPRLNVLWKVLAAGGLAALVGFLPPLPSLVRSVIAFAVYAAVILFTQALPPEFRALLPHRLTRTC
jgi:O-antigen/teichoic acid export membrane protein